MGSNGSAGKGKAIQWVRAHVGYAGDDCLSWPFHRVRGYGVLYYFGQFHYAHRMMCELVHGKPPTLKHETAHSCGRGHNGCVNPKHISWKTRAENQQDRRRHGTAGRGAAYGKRHKLTPEQVAEIRSLRGSMTITDIAAKFGVSRGNVRLIHLGETWKTGQYAYGGFSGRA